ncbi:MAG: hypothetical protein L0215_11425 [Gemmataceae bacterium]|nr:hypothetical protein [Gemmataceae bacterium]
MNIMFLSNLFLLSITLSPLIVEEATLVLPQGSEDWDFIGRFILKDDHGQSLTVRLYAMDSDSVAEKDFAKKKYNSWIYPNAFSLHAVYRSDQTDWKQRVVYASTRVRFNKVVKTMTNVVELQLRSNFEIDKSRKVNFTGEKSAQVVIDPVEEKIRNAINADVLANLRFTKQLSIRKGIPVLR